MNGFDRVPETDPNGALESLNENGSEDVVDDWLREESLDIDSREYVEAVSQGEDRTLAIPRFFGARNLEQTVLYASMSALDAASREIYGEGFDLRVLSWDDGFNPQVPGNRILAEPAVLVTEDRVQEMGLDEGTQNRMDNLDVEQVGSNGYLLNFRNFGDFSQNSGMDSIKTSMDSGEPAFLAKALDIPYSEVERPLDYFKRSSPLLETEMAQSEYQQEILRLLFEVGEYPETLKLKQNGKVQELKRRNGNYKNQESGSNVSEKAILDDGMMTAEGNYAYLVGQQQLTGLNYMWNGGWPEKTKFRPSETDSLVELAEDQGCSIRIPSVNSFNSWVPFGLQDAALEADFSNCAETDYGRSEAVGNLLISDEVMYQDLIAGYASEIVEAERRGLKAQPIEGFANNVLSRIGETYGV